MRLTRDEIALYKANLADWHSPQVMRQAVDKIRQHLGGKDMFNQGGVEFVRDAWIAMTFAELRGATGVRLFAEDRPDFCIRLANGTIEGFEAVEADEEGRRRGLEYNNPVQTIGSLDEPFTTSKQAFEVLQKAAVGKAKRAEDLAAKGTSYPPGTGLLIYLNLSDYEVYSAEIKEIFSPATETARRWFSSVWILWNERAYCVGEAEFDCVD